jgi:AcrR family transcriptional regulator
MAEELTAPPSRRERRRQAVREAILDAFVELAVERGWDGVTYAALAEHADVAERTVFRHFPSRTDLYEAFDSLLLERLAFAGFPSRLDDVPAFIEDLHRRFDEHADLMAVGVQAAAARRLPAQDRRLRALRDALADDLATADPLRAEEAVAVLDLLVSATCWHRLRYVAGLDGERAARAAADAARGVVDRLRQSTTTDQEDR